MERRSCPKGDGFARTRPRAARPGNGVAPFFVVLSFIAGGCGKKADRGREQARAARARRWQRAPELSCRISAPAEIRPGDGAAQAELILTNESETPLRVCTLCEEWQYLGEGWFEVILSPDDWKEGRPYPWDSEKHVAALEPGGTVSIPFRIAYVSGETLRVYASYAVGGTFGKGHKTWLGATRAGPVVVQVAEDCAVAPKRPLSADPLVDDLIEKLDSCLPPGWERLRVEEGKVRPAHLPEGQGTRVDYKETGRRLIKQQYNMIVWFMLRPDYDPPGPNPAVMRGAACTGPGRFIGENEHVRAYLWGGWPRADKEIPEKLGLTPAALSRGARTDNGLQIVLHPWVWQFETGEPVWATVEFRYLDNPSDLSDPLRFRGDDIRLSCSRGDETQNATVPFSEMRTTFPFRSGPPVAQWYSVNLNKHLDLSKPGRYAVRMSQIAEDKVPGRWHGQVRSNPLTIVMMPPEVGFVWSAPVEGLRWGVRVIPLNAVDLRLQNVGKDTLAALPLTGPWGRFFDGVTTIELLDAGKRVIGTYARDRARDMEELKKLAQYDRHEQAALILEPGEVHLGRLCFSLPELDYKKQQWVRVRYDTRPYAEVVQSVAQQQIWTGVLISPTMPLARPAGRR